MAKVYLKCLQDKHPPIEIGAEWTYVGRTPQTNIQDFCCSRKQVQIKFNPEDESVFVKPLGENASGLNGLQLERNKLYQVFAGDHLEILFGKHIHSIDIAEQPAEVVQVSASSSAHKRKSSSEPHIDEKKALTKKIKVALCSSWDSLHENALLVYTSEGVRASTKIASYDIDGTIIKTKSGKVFPTDYNDWQIAFDQVPGKLKELHRDDFKIVFFTNQAGMAKGKTDTVQWKQKLERIVKKLNVPVQVFVSTANGIYRKPRTGMWDQLAQQYNADIEICKTTSFYVGDAAGRPEKKGPPKVRKDHSLADRLFAMNVGITFATPEEHFQNKKPETWTPPLFQPAAASARDLLVPARSKLVSGELEVILMVGVQGSGKSKFAQTNLATAGYTIVNRDTLKSMPKCVEAMQDSLRRQKCVVIDNTNPDADSRKLFVTAAKKLGAKCRCFVMTTPLQHAKHNNVFRELIDSSHAKVADIVINTFNKNFVEPKLSEGFTEIVKVNFIATFTNKTHEALYKTFLLDK